MIETRSSGRNMVLVAVAALLLWAVQATSSEITNDPNTAGAEAAEIGTPAIVASLGSIDSIDSVGPIDAGYGWRVQLALADYGPLSPAQALYCRAEWTDPNRPAKAVPFGRFAGKHVGPVLWRLSEGGFREGPLRPSREPAPPMTLRGDGCIYAAVLPPSGAGEVYIQVYSAFDGRELARQRVALPDAPVSPWGRFMAHRAGELFGVAMHFEPAFVGLPAFRPLPAPSDPSPPTKLTLGLVDGLFALKADARILPYRGGRLLARWWVNDRPLTPQTAGETSLITYPDATTLATLFRVPATLPVASLNVQPGDKVSLQVMLAPDRVDWSAAYDAGGQNILCLDAEDIPTGPVVSNRIDFQVTATMLAQRNPAAPTTAQVAQLGHAIERRDVSEVRRTLAACPRLVGDGVADSAGPTGASSPKVSGGVVDGPATFMFGRSQQTALEYLCRLRPEPRELLWWRLGGNVTRRYWRQTAEVAEALIDYGADVNTQTRRNDTLLHALLDFPSSSVRQGKDAPPVELMQVLFGRGANPNVTEARDTLLWQVVEKIQSYDLSNQRPVVECLLENGANVFAVKEPFQREPVFEQADALGAALGDPIKRVGQARLAALEPRITLGVEELLADLRNADREALLTLERELPCWEGFHWARMGRSLHESLGVGLECLGPITGIRVAGPWAEAFLPTGRPGDRAYLHIVLMRYPGGAYHAIRASLTSVQTQTDANSIEGSTRQIIAAIDYALGRIDASAASGHRKGTIPRGVEALVVTDGRGRLAVESVQPPGWRSFYAELTPSAVLLWEDAWELSLGTQATWETAPRQIVVEDGVLTVRNDATTLTFDVHNDQVRLRTDGSERLAPQFRVDMQTLEVTGTNGSTEPNVPPDSSQ